MPGFADFAGITESEGEEDRISRLCDSNAGSDRAHVSAAFMAKDAGIEGYWCCACRYVTDEDVGVTDPGGDNIDEQFAVLRLADVDRLKLPTVVGVGVI